MSSSSTTNSDELIVLEEKVINSKRRLSNFLKSANLDLIDPLTLPDPPTPEDKAIISKQKLHKKCTKNSSTLEEVVSTGADTTKEQCCASATGAVLRDVTNAVQQVSHGWVPSSGVTQQKYGTSANSKKGLLIPAVVERSHTTVTNSVNNSPEREIHVPVAGTLDKPPQQQRIAKRKRRQTILPTDDDCLIATSAAKSSIPNQDDQSLVNVQAVAVSQGLLCPATAHPTKDYASHSRTQEMELLQLVRKYCSLPHNDPARQPIASQIETLSGGYKLVSPYQQGAISAVAAITTSSLDKDVQRRQEENRRRQFLLTLMPTIENMEQRRKKEVDFIHAMTGCRVEKVRKDQITEYVYYDTRIQKEVSSEEYTRRYYLDVHSSNKQQWLTEEMFHGTKDVEDRNSSKSPDFIPSSKALGVTATPFAVNVKQRVDISSEADSNAAINCSEDIKEDPLIIPRRGEVSSNPDIARAQEKLWKALDAALSEYSNEVMQILDRSARGHHQTERCNT